MHPADPFLAGTLQLDLETDLHDPPRIREIGARRLPPDGAKEDGVVEERRWKLSSGSDDDLTDALDDLDRFADGCRRVLGHNLLRHDLPILERLRPELRLLGLPVVDTLDLSPLAFPQVPYHALVKDYRLEPQAVSDPVADARLAGRLFRDEWEALASLGSEDASDILPFYAACFAADDAGADADLPGTGFRGTVDALEAVAGRPRLCPDDARTYFYRHAARHGCCRWNLDVLRDEAQPPGPELAYALAWLRVAGTGSVTPPWVRRAYPRLPELLDLLRRPTSGLCGSRDDCRLCDAGTAPVDALRRIFGFGEFRPEPRADDGSSLQETVTARGLARRPLLAILATGAGKSVCYQLPALVHHERRGELTIVISPLQALMRDQVEGLRRLVGGERAGALYGLLTPLERGRLLERVRLGKIALLYVAPEQLRNRSFLHTVAQREIGAWVYDEAHCLSKWGHDFRPDYLYAARFIRDLAARQGRPVPPVACFTATAKEDVIAEIRAHVAETLGQKLEVFRSAVDRPELEFRVENTPPQRKLPRVAELLADLGARRVGEEDGEDDDGGSAVVYFASRRATEEAARFLAPRLAEAGLDVEHFHAGLPQAEKRRILDAFSAGAVRVVCATNAFGMGIDKDDVRLVVHAEVPGSLESYLQEAGRAGRDRDPARCVLLFDQADVERQFRLAAFSRLDHRELVEILRAVRRAVRRTARGRRDGVAALTPGDLLRDEKLALDLHPGDPIAGTKVRMAVAWLERGGFVERTENRTRVFQGRLRVASVPEAEEKLRALDLDDAVRRRWLAVIRALLAADPESGLGADELAQLPEAGFEGENAGREVMRTLAEMASRGLLEKGLQLVAHLDRHRAPKTLGALSRLERTLVEVLQEEAPDADASNARGGWQELSIRRLNQHLLDRLAEPKSHPELLRRLLDGLADLDRTPQGGAHGRAVDVRAASRERYRLRLHLPWDDLRSALDDRAREAAVILGALVRKIPDERKGRRRAVVGLEDLVTALQMDLAVAPERSRPEVAERALLHLHEQRVIHLQNGLAVFRQAMTLRLEPDAHGRAYTRRDYAPLEEHHRERTFQVHVVARYARLAAERLGEGWNLVREYFERPRDELVARHFAGDEALLERATGEESHRRIVELGDAAQEAVVTAPVDADLLVLAGPGSGKTRVVVHRAAWLLRVARVPSRSVVILAFNRNAALEVRRRLHALVGEDARGVTVTTYHGMALRLVGHSFATEKARDELDLARVIGEAVDLLRDGGEEPGLLAETGGLTEADDLRERLLAGVRHVLVDEYQDITEDQYELVRALATAGEGKEGGDDDEAGGASILAVGDDDQTIYGWAGAEVAFLRRFEEDYAAERHVLGRCYRATGHLLAASNAFVAGIPGRLKNEPLRLPQQPTQGRADGPGGRWAAVEPSSGGRVRVVRVDDPRHQAAAVGERLAEMKRLDEELRWRDCLVLARTRATLHAVRAALEHAGIPVAWAAHRSKLPPLHRVREIALFLDRLRERAGEDLDRPALQRLELDVLGPFRESAASPWRLLLRDLLREWCWEMGNHAAGAGAIVEHLYDGLVERRREPTFGRGVRLSTVHAAKGLEFPHVIVVDDGWRAMMERRGDDAARGEEERLFYVAMTRAEETLQLFHFAGKRNGHPHVASLLRRVRDDESAERAVQEVDAPAPRLPVEVAEEVTQRRYDVLGLEDLYLSWVAVTSTFRHEREREVAVQRLAGLEVGSPVRLERRGKWIFVVAGSEPVARLSAAGAERWVGRLERVREARVLAMVRRYSDDGDPRHLDRHALERWEVPVVEVVSQAGGPYPILKPS